MEKRKAYIITSFIILTLLTGLAFWYLYTAKQDLKIGQVTDLELYGAGESVGRPNIDSKPQSPFGGLGSTSPGISAGLNEIIPPTQEDALENEPESWQLVQIHSEPSVGASIVSGIIQFIDQKTGNIYKSIKGEIKERISGATLQQVHDSYTMPDGSVIVIKSDGSVPSQVTMDSEEPVVTDTLFEGGILQSARSGSYIYYTNPNNDGGIHLKSTRDTTKVLWSSHLSGWLLQVVDDYIVVTQKASHNIPGYSYILPKQGGTDSIEPRPIAQDLPGLITNLSPDASQLLYSTSGKKGTTLYLKALENSDIIPLSIKTLASKCAWGGDNATFYCAVPSVLANNLPDSWYKGQAHFTDSLWRINAITGDAFELAHETGLDIIEIVEDSENGVMVFKNNTNQSLWAVIKN